jgi:hypothetical protein
VVSPQILIIAGQTICIFWQKKKINLREVLPFLRLEQITNHSDKQCKYKFPTNGGLSNLNSSNAVFMSGRQLVLLIYSYG